jgi:hypothetical protein
MRKVSVLCVLLIMAMPVMAQKTKHFKASSKVGPEIAPFVGTWKLVSSTQRLPDGTVRPYSFGPHAVGMLMYDATGHMCVQVMNPDRPQWKDPDHPAAEEVRTSLDGFGGYCGRFTVDVEKHTLTHLPDVSFDPNIMSKPSPRNYTFDGDRLIYDGTDTSEGVESHWTMTWERVQ